LRDIKRNETANKIGESGAKIISESLKCNSTLTVLSLSCDDMKQIQAIEEERKRRQ